MKKLPNTITDVYGLFVLVFFFAKVVFLFFSFNLKISLKDKNFKLSRNTLIHFCALRLYTREQDIAFEKKAHNLVKPRQFRGKPVTGELSLWLLWDSFHGARWSRPVSSSPQAHMQSD